jgi:ATP-dependent RNA helicase DDX23/PRP28
MTERDWRIFREDNKIYVRGGRVSLPIRAWTEASLSEQLTNNLRKAGFVTPKPVQSQAVPIGLARKDMIALAPTGDGKTLAFLIPLIEHLFQLPPAGGEAAEGPFAMILVPTRELAEQIGQ